MKHNVAAVGLMLFVFAIILFGVHKNDVNTQQDILNNTHRITAAAVQQEKLAHKVCLARNKAVLASNVRWNNEKLAWTAAADARRAQAKAESDPALAKIDLSAAKTYQRVADSIVPYPTTNCG